MSEISVSIPFCQSTRSKDRSIFNLFGVKDVVFMVDRVEYYGFNYERELITLTL